VRARRGLWDIDLQDGNAFVLFVGFHKTSDRDLVRAVREAEKHLADYRSEQN
jgi:hypothetical protein